MKLSLFFLKTEILKLPSQRCMRKLPPNPLFLEQTPEYLEFPSCVYLFSLTDMKTKSVMWFKCAVFFHDCEERTEYTLVSGAKKHDFFFLLLLSVAGTVAVKLARRAAAATRLATAAPSASTKTGKDIT